MSIRIRVCAVSIISVAAIAGCGGGGGGGGVIAPGAAAGTPVEVGFTSFSAIRPNQTAVIDATVITGNATGTADGAGSVTVDSVSFTGEAPGTVRVTLDGAGQVSGVNISAPQPNSSVSFSRDAGHSIACSDATCVAESPTATAAVIDPLHVSTNWNYQSFGVWASDTGTTTAVFGAFSAGSPTPASSIPLSGNAVFNGLTAGLYVDAAGTPFGTASTMTADVNFSTRTIGFSTSDMNLVNANNGAQSTRPDLRLSGTLNYAAGVNSFGGNVTTAHPTASDRLNGTASGRFYGPAAQEIGGVYSLSGNGRERMIGGFGGAKQP